jgi:hypothetical protein
MIWLISKLLMQPLISLFQFYYVTFLYVNGPLFGRTNKNLGKFLRESAVNLQLCKENNKKDRTNHALTSDGPNELRQCILLGASCVQRVFHALISCFSELPIFNATKIFNPCNYPRMIVTGS